MDRDHDVPRYDPAGVDAHLRRVADALDRRPERVEESAQAMLDKLDRLQRELDRLLGGLKSTAETLAAVAPSAPPPAGERSADLAGARLVALTMAREGTPREETAQFLAEHYAVPDLDALLDAVYASPGT
jgi:hypothetical protein